MSFEWPWQYRFPPFFTIQPQEETREKQLEAWKTLIVEYAKQHGINRLVVAECPSMPLFNNKDINRHLDLEGVGAVLSYLEKTGHIEWKDASRTECALYWQSPIEWAEVIYKWACDVGQTDTVLTFFELLEGDTGAQAPFHGMDKYVFIKSLRQLEKEGRGEVFAAEEGEEIEGVKIFA
eukprot:m.76070 g.76070  ORF g.76070 m.76070 type:complete len:179 (-) comp11866_c0_seq4:142-678(-)